jgi:hypothetical protein
VAVDEGVDEVGDDGVAIDAAVEALAAVVVAEQDLGEGHGLAADVERVGLAVVVDVARGGAPAEA